MKYVEHVQSAPGYFACCPTAPLARTVLVTQRAEMKDYLDIHALLTKANIPLSQMLAAAAAIDGSQFNPLISLKAISYHDDPALAQLPQQVRRDLIAAVRDTNPEKLPKLQPLRPRKPAS